MIQPESLAAPYRVLARKYRPQTFSQLVGQDALVRTLSNAIVSGRLAHAFVLTGVRGVGKTSAARIIARALNCIGPDGSGTATPDPCGVCENCRAIAEDRHPDVLEMDAASRTGVDDVREIIEGVRYRPVSARFKVYIIDEVHMLSKNAFNALLKTLEEPPEHVIFIFATTEVRRVPVTVLSRCQRFDLVRVPHDVLVAHLQGIAEREEAKAEADALSLIARAAEGSVRDALSLLDQAIALAADHKGGPAIATEEVQHMLGYADRALVLDLFEAVMAGKGEAALALYDRLHEAGTEAALILQDLLDTVYGILRLKVAADAGAGPGVPEDDARKLRKFADSLPLPVLTRAWQLLLKGLGEVQMAPVPHQAGEVVIIRLLYMADLPTPGEVLARIEAGGAPVSASKSAASQTSPAKSAGSPPPVSAPVASAAFSQPAPSGGRGSSLNGGHGPAPAPVNGAGAAAMPASFEELVALFHARREAIMAAHLTNDVRLLRFAPGLLEVMVENGAPSDLAPRLRGCLEAWTARPWTVTVGGRRRNGAVPKAMPTLQESAAAEKAQRYDDAARDPLVAAVLETFPGARIEEVCETTTQQGKDAGH